MLATKPTASTSRSAISGGRRGSSGSAPKAVGEGAERLAVAAEPALRHLQRGEVVQRRADGDLLQVDEHRAARRDAEVAGVRVGVQQDRRPLQRADAAARPAAGCRRRCRARPATRSGSQAGARSRNAAPARWNSASARPIATGSDEPSPGASSHSDTTQPSCSNGPSTGAAIGAPGGGQVVGQLDQVGAAAVDAHDARRRPVDRAARRAQQHQRPRQPERRPCDRCQLAHFRSLRG